MNEKETERSEQPAQAAPSAEAPVKEKLSARNYHVTKRREDGKWQVKYARGSKALKLFDTQAEAVAYAQKIADNCDGSVVVHKVTGQIRKLKEKTQETEN